MNFITPLGGVLVVWTIQCSQFICWTCFVASKQVLHISPPHLKAHFVSTVYYVYARIGEEVKINSDRGVNT